MEKPWFMLMMCAFALAAGVAYYALHIPSVCNNRLWKAMVTPLSSIIGSGFLLATPLMYSLIGGWSLVGMPIMLILAYLVGYALRFNIFYVEPLLARNKNEKIIITLELLVSPALAFAYIISVTYYLKILSSFIMRGFGIVDEFQANILTTMVLFALTLVGRLDGLDMMEHLERYAIGIKLSIIAGLLAALVVFNLEAISLTTWVPEVREIKFDDGLIGKLLGMFVIVQGFETSRYLGSKYSNKERALTMKYAQILTSLIFILFTFLVYTLSAELAIASDTAIVDMINVLSPLLGYILIFAALMSQFGAATADKVACSALVSELSGGRLSINDSILIIGFSAMVVTWTSDVFGTIALASKAFAFYYSLQTIQSAIVAYRMKGEPYRILKIALFSFLSLCMLAVTIFSLPAL